MKRVLLIAWLPLLLSLSACDNTGTTSANAANTISVAELTEREQAILSTTTDNAFVFDFNTGGKYEKANVWVEKYEAGKLVEEKVSAITTGVEEEGSIIFAISKVPEEDSAYTFDISVSSNGATGIISSFETIPLENAASMWGSGIAEDTALTEEMVLASITYSDDGKGMSSLSSDFYKDAASHLDEISDYDLVYLLRSEFVK